MIHIQVAQNHDISIPQLIKKSKWNWKKNLSHFSWRGERGGRIIYDAKMTFLKNSFTAYITHKKGLRTDFKWINFPHAQPLILMVVWMKNSISIHCFFHSVAVVCRVILCFVIAPGTANRCYFFWVTGSFQIHTCQNRKLKKVEIFLCHCHLSIVVLWKIQLCF